MGENYQSGSSFRTEELHGQFRSHAATLGSGLYVDVENLGNDGARGLVDSVLDEWPESVPRPTKVRLYVKGDTTALWRMRFLDRENQFTVSVKGVQHYDSQGSKNSADIAIAVDAITDYVTGQVGHVAVFSDDSDYISLFDKIVELWQDTDGSVKRAPFLWILTNRTGNKSVRIREFIPADYLHFTGSLASHANSELDLQPKNSSSTKPEQASLDVAHRLIQELPIGKYKSADFKKIVMRDFPSHQMAGMNDAAFGAHFSKSIWPLLEKKGAKLAKAKSPRTYEITSALKNSKN